MGAQARGTEASPARHRAIDLARVPVFRDLDSSRAPTAKRFAFDADEPQFDPVVAVTGILEEHAVELVGAKGPPIISNTSCCPLLSMSPNATACPFWKWPKPPEVVTF